MKTSRDRGCPRGRHNKLADFTALEYIDCISIKYNLDLNVFFNSFVEAWQCQESKFENLVIECREKTREYATFLITKDLNVVAQFHIPNRILQKTNPLKNFISARSLRPKIRVKVRTENFFIRDLKFGMKGINLTGKITEISKSNIVYSRLGKTNSVANAKLSDETGFIQLPLWNQQIQMVSTGDIIQIENARVVSFRGKLQLKLRRSCQLKIIEKTVSLNRP